MLSKSEIILGVGDAMLKLKQIATPLGHHLLDIDIHTGGLYEKPT